MALMVERCLASTVLACLICPKSEVEVIADHWMQCWEMGFDCSLMRLE